MSSFDLIWRLIVLLILKDKFNNDNENQKWRAIFQAGWQPAFSFWIKKGDMLTKHISDKPFLSSFDLLAIIIIAYTFILRKSFLFIPIFLKYFYINATTNRLSHRAVKKYTIHNSLFFCDTTNKPSCEV